MPSGVKRAGDVFSATPRLAAELLGVRSRPEATTDKSVGRGGTTKRACSNGAGPRRGGSLGPSSPRAARGRGGAGARGKRRQGCGDSFALRHGRVRSRLLAQLQEAAGDCAAPPEKVSEPWCRCALRTAGAHAPPRSAGGRAAPALLPELGRQRRRHDRRPQEPFRPPGQPAAGRRRGSRAAVSGSAGSSGLGESPRRAAGGQRWEWAQTAAAARCRGAGRRAALEATREVSSKSPQNTPSCKAARMGGHKNLPSHLPSGPPFSRAL